MRYYSGDIVEIITARYKSYDQIPLNERAYYDHHRMPAPYRGQRFRIAVAYPLLYARFVYQGHQNLIYGITPDHVKLYHRPWRNRFRALVRFFRKQFNLNNDE